MARTQSDREPSGCSFSLRELPTANQNDKDPGRMGLMRFLVPQRERVSDEAVQRAYIAGLDTFPTPAHKSWEGDHLLRLDRSIDESGNLFIPWRVDGHGELLLSTASLMERDEPYHLPVELARGTVNRLRTQADVWQIAGLELSDELAAQMKSATALFTHAATSQQDPEIANAAAEEAIRRSLDAMVLLGEQYARQVLEMRREETSPLPTISAGNLGDAPMPVTAEPMFGAAFNAAVIPFTWSRVEANAGQWQWSLVDKQIQFCHRYGLKVFGGPLLRLERGALPDWVLACQHDFEQLAQGVQRYVNATVERYRGQVHLWHCAGGVNAVGALSLSDEQRLRLTVFVIELTRRADPRTPLMVSVDQPWAEYLAKGETDLSPMHFAEMLVRADIGVAAIGLEMNFGYWPGGTLPRDVLEISQHVDQWSLLGLPLILLVNFPSRGGEDPLAAPDAGRPIPDAPEGGPCPESQKRCVERFLPVLLAKPSVQAIVWNQVFDSMPHKYPHAGLFDDQCLPKPALSSLIEIRRKHLE